MRVEKRFSVIAAVAAIVLIIPAVPSGLSAQVAVSVTIAPPVLPVYVQPPCPATGYIWTPGYWAWGPEGYYWVPGTWVEPPAVGLLWTPGYWGWSGGIFVWHAGYWGPRVGFYGGVVYGFGYDGVGYGGGFWRGSQFYYNTTVTNVNTTVIRNVYRRPVAVRSETRVSYNGGRGGIAARPTPEQERVAREGHRPPTAMQMEQQRSAGRNRELLASVNHGRPAIAATPRPGLFNSRRAAPAKGPRDGVREIRPSRSNLPPRTNLNRMDVGSGRVSRPAGHPVKPPSSASNAGKRPKAPHARPAGKRPEPLNRHHHNPPPVPAYK